MTPEQYREYGFDPGPEDWQATFAWISWRDGLCYPPPHHAPTRDESWFAVACCDLISLFWVLGKTLRRMMR
jgi:hypothetical protein